MYQQVDKLTSVFHASVLLLIMKFITLLSGYGSTSRGKEFPFLKVGDAGRLAQGNKIKDFGLPWDVHDETR